MRRIGGLRERGGRLQFVQLVQLVQDGEISGVQLVWRVCGGHTGDCGCNVKIGGLRKGSGGFNLLSLFCWFRMVRLLAFRGFGQSAEPSFETADVISK